MTARGRVRPLRYLTAADVDGGDAAARRAAAPRRADDGRARRRRRAAAEDRRPSAAGRLVRPRDAGPPARAPIRTARDDLLGIKWIAGFPANRARGLRRDPRPGPPDRPGDRRPDRDPRRRPDHRRADRGGQRRRDRPVRAARSRAGRRGSPMLGAGVQGRSHLRGPRRTSCRASSWRSSTATRIGRRRSPTRPRGPTGIGARDAAPTRPRRDPRRRRRRHGGVVRAGRRAPGA